MDRDGEIKIAGKIYKRSEMRLAGPDFTLTDALREHSQKEARIPKNDFESYIKKHFQVRRNLVLGRLEFKENMWSEFRPMNDTDLNSMNRQLKSERFSSSTRKIMEVLNSDFTEPFHPFKSYFSKLRWDGTNYIQQLAETVKTNQDELWHKAFKKWLVGVVACALNEENINQQVIVFSGVQGIGKSTWLENLIPKSLGKKYLYSGLVYPESKETQAHLSEKLLINMDELESLNKSEQGELKAMISKSSINLRKAYAYFSEHMERRASFVGSVNDFEFLTDLSGNRRYLCFTALSIDYKNKFDMNKAYAQAYYLYRNGENGERFKWWFDDAEIDEINKNNLQFTRTTPEEEFLNKYFKVPNAEDEEIRMTPSDIMSFILKKEGILLNHKILGSVMRKQGFLKVSTATSKPYKLAFRKDIDAVDNRL